MSDKERLEEIKEAYRWTIDNSLVPRLSDSDTEWLINQAERVEELEEERDEWKDTAQSYYVTNQELREQNQRYREEMVSALSEIEYALYSNKSQKVKEHYLKNAKRYINQALEGDEN